MKDPEPTVIVIDDDPSFRRSLERLIRSDGFTVKAYPSAQEFMRAWRPDGPCCLVLDVRMPGLNGLDLQRDLKRAGVNVPVVFITGHGDIPMSVQAMKAGAVEFLTKPFREEDLLNALRQAIDQDRMARKARASVAELRQRYETLTPRERDVMLGVVAGKLNKQIAGDLGTTEKTVKFHRAHIMKKMQAGSLADLVRMAGRLEGPAPTT